MTNIFSARNLFLLSFLAISFTGCQPGKSDPKSPSKPPIVSPADPAAPAAPGKLGGNGLSNRVFDNCIRVRTQGGSGSGSIVDETPSHYVMESNAHVTRKGTANQLDIFVGGKLVGVARATTNQSWYKNGSAHDVAEVLIPKSQLGGPLPVVKTAPPGYSSKLKPGQAIYTYGCQQGQWPRARHGNILSISNGVIYYEPPAIPGDSGSAVYVYDDELGEEIAIGRTAWTTENHTGRPGGKPAGMAMTSDRVRAIRNGEVSFDPLPPGAKEIEPAPNADPAETEVLFQRWKPREWTISPQSSGPLRSGLRQSGMNLRSGLGYGLTFIGLGLGVSVVIYVVRAMR